MNKDEKIYLLELQFLGFRYHGWAQQPGLKTVHGMVNKTINFVLGGNITFKTLGAGRTDAMVSARYYPCELRLRGEVFPEEFVERMNQNLPQDIKCLGMKELPEGFNIIQSVKEKEYAYYFSTGKKEHPFTAPWMSHILQELNIDSMQSAARHFEGEHDFRQFCYKPRKEVETIRSISQCCIQSADNFPKDFFPKQVWKLKVKGKGFMRHQVRLMMGALIKVGNGEIRTQDITRALNYEIELEPYIAPASGLVLEMVSFN